MSKSVTAQEQTSQRQARKLSPELSEFLHMLQSLEGQLGEQISNRRVRLVITFLPLPAAA